MKKRIRRMQTLESSVLDGQVVGYDGNFLETDLQKAWMLAFSAAEMSAREEIWKSAMQTHFELTVRYLFSVHSPDGKEIQALVDVEVSYDD